MLLLIRQKMESEITDEFQTQLSFLNLSPARQFKKKRTNNVSVKKKKTFSSVHTDTSESDSDSDEDEPI